MEKNNFREAIESTKEIRSFYREGLKALGSSASKIHVSNPKQIDGSIDIDAASIKKYPHDNRWDYAIGYSNRVFYVEIHPAYTAEVVKMIAKLQWLKKWLKQNAIKLGQIEKGTPPYSWIQSGKGGILPGSRQAKMAAIYGLKPMKQLILK